MKEAEWLQCDRPTTLLESLPRDRSSERKLRLLGCACIRRVWHLLTEKGGRRAVEATERFVDGLLNRQAIAKAGEEATWAIQYAAGEAQFALRAASVIADVTWVGHLDVIRRRVGDAMGLARCAGKDAEVEGMAQVFLLGDVFGNPFRRVSLDPSWLTPAVVSLARPAYEERDLPSGHLDAARLAVLADALEEAGCTDADLLGHLRGPGPHVRGCHAVDLVLGRE